MRARVVPVVSLSADWVTFELQYIVAAEYRHHISELFELFSAESLPTHFPEIVPAPCSAAHTPANIKTMH